MAMEAGWTALPGTPPVEMKLFVGRVPKNVEEDELRPIFEVFGPIVELTILRDKNTNLHKGSAFVRMASITQADAAIRCLNGLKVLDPSLGPLQVRYANNEADKLNMPLEAGVPGHDQAKLFVGSLPKTATEDEVREVFGSYGQVDEVFVMKDPSTGQGKGCAFVKFAYKEQALHAIKCINGSHQMAGGTRPLEVRFAESRRYGRVAATANKNPRAAGSWKEYFTDDGRPYYYNEATRTTTWDRPPEFDSGGDTATGPPGANIFVFHVPNSWTRSDLLDHFGQFGMILSARIATDKATNRNKGYAFVSYSNVHSAAQAVQRMNGFLAGGTKRLKVSIKQNEEAQHQRVLYSVPPYAAPFISS